MYPFFTAMQNLWLLVNYDKKSQEIAKWVANICMYLSAIVLAVSIPMATQPDAYIGFLIAHIVWAFFAFKIKDTALFWQFAFFIPFDLYAIYIRF